MELMEELFHTPFGKAYFLFAAFLFGTAFGSFFNCMAWRLVHGESVLKGRSHCPGCGHTLGAPDLIPVLSYLLLKGRCRYCGERISPRYLVGELVCGAGWLVCVLRWGVTWEAAGAVILFCLLFVLSLVDLESMIIPDRFLIAAAVNWAVFLPLLNWKRGEGFYRSVILAQLRSGLMGALALGGGMLLMILIFEKFTGKESMGGGDLKLFAVCGLYLGAAKGLLCVILSCFIGLIAAAIGHKGRSNPFPFGPSIALALFLCLIFGDAVLVWYLSLILG